MLAASQMSKELRRQERAMIYMEKKKMAQDIMIFSVAISSTPVFGPGPTISMTETTKLRRPPDLK